MVHVTFQMKCPLVILASLIGLAGCVLSGVDPAHPKPGVGYVDFYSHSLYAFDILGADATQRFPTGSRNAINQIVRIASPPGSQIFVIVAKHGSKVSSFEEERAIIRVAVEPGKVSPVEVFFKASIRKVEFDDLQNASEIRETPSAIFDENGMLTAVRLFLPNPVAGKPRSFGRKSDMPYYKPIPLL